MADEVERDNLIHKCLVLIYAAYDRELAEVDSVSLKIKLSSWKLALETVPSRELERIVRLELQERTNEFMPVPADILHRWKGAAAEETVANAAAYKPLQPTENELAMGALPAAEGAGRAAYIALGEQLRRSNRREPNTPKRQKPTDPRRLNLALHDWLHMATWEVSNEVRQAFGLWLLERYLPDEWTPELGREQWAIWQRTDGADMMRAYHAEKAKKAATEKS